MSGPVIHTVHSGNLPVLSLGDAGTQQVVFGAPRGDASPLLMGVSRVWPGGTTALIRHESAELAYVLSGAGSMITDRLEYPFAAGDGVLIEAGCWHAICAADDVVEMLFVFPSPDVPPTQTHPSAG